MPVQTITVEALKRWADNPLICCQPMVDYVLSYRGHVFEAKGGYWWFNGYNYAIISALQAAIDSYEDEIRRRLDVVADS